MSTRRPIIIAFAVLSLSGCAHGERAADLANNPTPSPALQTDQMGPPPPPGDGLDPQAPIGPLPAPGFVPPKEGYVLVLGPGLARAMAYIGVLRELESRNLPIHGIVGVEMGALIGGIWASSNSNNLEWEMHKFRRDTLLDLPVFGLGDRVAEGRKLVEFLDQALKSPLLQQMKAPTIIVSAEPNSDTIFLESNGSAKDIIRGAMSIPGLLKPYVFDGKERESAAFVLPFPVGKAKDLAVGKVVCVDVLGRGDNFKAEEAAEAQLATLMRSVGALARLQLRDCDSVISIPMDDVSYLNFETKADLISRGRAATRKWLESSQ